VQQFLARSFATLACLLIGVLPASAHAARIDLGEFDSWLEGESREGWTPLELGAAAFQVAAPSCREASDGSVSCFTEVRPLEAPADRVWARVILDADCGLAEVTIEARSANRPDRFSTRTHGVDLPWPGPGAGSDPVLRALHEWATVGTSVILSRQLLTQATWTGVAAVQHACVPETPPPRRPVDGIAGSIVRIEPRGAEGARVFVATGGWFQVVDVQRAGPLLGPTRQGGGSRLFGAEAKVEDDSGDGETSLLIVATSERFDAAHLAPEGAPTDPPGSPTLWTKRAARPTSTLRWR